MREILFRGKSINSKMIVYSMSISNGTIKRKQNDMFMEIEPNKWVGVHPESISQFTGVTDKNGKKIFEGDSVKKIVKSGFCFDKEGTVVFENGKFFIRATDEDMDFNLKSYWDDGQCHGDVEYELEIISNE